MSRPRKERPMIGEEVIAIWDDGIDGAELYEVQKLVRCKDCMFGMVYQNDSSGVESIWCKAFTTPRMVTDDDYCSYGERKGE